MNSPYWLEYATQTPVLTNLLILVRAYQQVIAHMFDWLDNQIHMIVSIPQQQDICIASYYQLISQSLNSAAKQSIL